MSAAQEGFPEIPGYRITGRLGQGSMAVVYRAIQLEMDRPVALKVLRADLFRDERARARILREARLAARSSHPHVVRVHDAGVAGGCGWLAMDLVEGRTLKELLDLRGPVDEETVLDWARQIASALERFEADGLVHRDIKPGNVLVDNEGRALLLDFGLATITWDTRYRTRSRGVGTPAYMAPEQASDPDGVTIRSDFFALGATLYHLTTGKSAFDATQLSDVISRILYHMPPGPKTLAPNLSRGFDALILRMLAKDPSDRPADVAALRAALDRLPGEEAPSDRAPGVVSKTGLFAGIAAGLLIAAAVFLVTTKDDVAAPEEGAAADEVADASPADLGAQSTDNLARATGADRAAARVILGARARAALDEMMASWETRRAEGDWRSWSSELEADRAEAILAAGMGFAEEPLDAGSRSLLAEAMTIERRRGLAILEPLRAASLLALEEALDREADALERAGLSQHERQVRYEAVVATFRESGPPIPDSRLERRVRARIESDRRRLVSLRNMRFAALEEALREQDHGRVRRGLDELRRDPRFADDESRARAEALEYSLLAAEGRISERLALAAADFKEQGLHWGDRADVVSRFPSARPGPLDPRRARAWLDRVREGLPLSEDDVGEEGEVLRPWRTLQALHLALEKIEGWDARIGERWGALTPGTPFFGTQRSGRVVEGAKIVSVDAGAKKITFEEGGERRSLLSADLDLATWLAASEAALPSAAAPHERVAHIWLRLVAGDVRGAWALFDAAEADGVAPPSLEWLRAAAQQRLADDEGVESAADRILLLRLRRLETARREAALEPSLSLAASLAEALGEGESSEVSSAIRARHADWCRETLRVLERSREGKKRFDAWGPTRIVDLERGELELSWAPSAEKLALLASPEGLTSDERGFRRRLAAATVVPSEELVFIAPSALDLDGRQDWELSFRFRPEGDGESAFRWLLFGLGDVRAGQLDRLRQRARFRTEPWHGLERGLSPVDEIGQAVIWEGPAGDYRRAFRSALATPSEGILEKDRNQRFRLVMTTESRRVTLWRGSRRLAATTLKVLPRRAGVHFSFPMPGSLFDMKIRGVPADQVEEAVPR